MHLSEQFKKNITDHNLFQQHDKLLLAVSGGLDSVVLCELCRQAGYSFEVAHANFQLRDQESEADEQFVRSIANQYGVPIHVMKFDTATYAAENKLSIQVAARELRYGWFGQLLSDGLKWLLTAHHASDNIETMMMHFFRGTGISGLRGMLPVQGKIVRPLLPFTREMISTFAAENKLQWREDSSNSSDKYSRNYFRNTIIPMVTKVFPEADHNLIQNLERFRDTELLYDQAIELHKKKLLEKKGAEIHIPVLKLKKSSPLKAIIYEIIKPYHFSAHQVTDVVHLLEGAQGKYVQSSTHRIIRNRNWLIIASSQPASAEYIVIEKNEDNILLPTGCSVNIQTVLAEKVKLGAEKEIAHIDLRKIVYPLIVRRWKNGDYFYPLGMTKKKKISRFLIDQKLSLTEKQNVWVLESDKRICWVVGMRIDERFKVSGLTKQVLTLHLNC